MARQVAKGIRFTFPGGRSPASAWPASAPRAGPTGQSQELILSSTDPPFGGLSLLLRHLLLPGLLLATWTLRQSPPTVRPSLLALCGSQHTISSRRHLLSASPHCRADSGCGLCGGQELRPCSPALARENSVASGAAKLCHASISQGACKRLVPVAQPSPTEAELLGENKSREEALGLFSLFKTSAHGV